MEEIRVETLSRTETGKNVCKQIRKEGFVPAVVYGKGKESQSIQVNIKDLWNALHTEAGGNAIITLDISGGGKRSTKTVIVQETQTDPIRENIIHVDFHEISMTEKIKVKVPVSLKGEAVGVKEEDGVLNQVLWEIEVE